MSATLRIGTWNLAGRWSAQHRDVLESMDCDVLLLTEVRRDVALHGYDGHLTLADMAERRARAGVLTRAGATSLPDPHPASAAVAVGETTYCSSILPWRGARGRPLWPGARHEEWTRSTIVALGPSLTGQVVWGGDFNHALTGKEWSGSKGGRGHIDRLLSELGLAAPTTHLPHRIEGLLSIDHIAVPSAWTVLDAGRTVVGRLSDHDAYTVEVAASSGP